MDVFPVAWEADDVDGAYTITVHGKTPDATLVAARIAFYPYFYVRLPAGYGPGQAKLFVTETCAKYRALPQYSRVVERVSLWGFTNQTKVPLVQLAFPTLRTMKWAARELGKGHTTFESSVDPLLRFFHIRDISPAAWISIKSHTTVQEKDQKTRATLEIATGFDKVSPSSRTERPPLVLASWDLETHSASRKFPCAENEDDVIIQIATSFARYGDPEPYRTLIMAFKDTAAVEGVDLMCFEDEADMINAWLDELANEGVDILTGYNTDQVSSFKCFPHHAPHTVFQVLLKVEHVQLVRGNRLTRHGVLRHTLLFCARGFGHWRVFLRRNI